MKELKEVIKIVLQEKKDVWLSVLFGFLAGISAVGLFASSGYLISRAALLPPLYALTVLIAFLKLFGFIRALGRYAERYYSHRATFTMLSKIRVTFYERLEPYATKVLHKYRSGDLLSRIVGDVESLQNFFLRVFYPPIVMIVIFLSTIAFTTIFSVSVALILVIGLILTGFLIPLWFSYRQRKVKRMIRESRGSLSTEAAEFFYGFRDLKIYQQVEQKQSVLEEASDTYVREQEGEGKQLVYNHSVNTMITLMVSWLVLAAGAFLVSTGQLNGLFLAMLVMISLTVFENATPMAVLPGHLEENKQASKRLFSITEEKEIESRERVQIHQAPGITLENVSYTYPGEERSALKGIDLQIPKGSKTAIIGSSGSGKSTLFQLLLQALRADEGEVWFDDIAGSLTEPESIWEQSRVVLQKNHFFYGSIRDNLKIAKEEASDEMLNTILQKVGLDAFALEGEVLEKGENLSGGEKQRLAIARAMLKNGSLWMLDEPTSSLDAVTEKGIYDEIFNLAQKDTLVLISHRLTGLEKMDQIVVVDEGKIVESGTFEQLMEKQGYFYEMKQIEQSVFST
ncbi:thiol reductant ABC exporter subunit CydC [Halobacillus yeomjeoni]|uniref:thiol reductant ABC exporter subunit CydC n=1 Tax=Halobacillus yeomjeoni TaxID=311194 RepID=UPI001CD2F79C|nr:thiol reductant ABC exporter subunit CydC [Halobacillus yeomjeoni]MCA0984966.1 thiol reductant ABC exporter subunit CydC [Halobacillus yeomjeoni]